MMKQFFFLTLSVLLLSVYSCKKNDVTVKPISLEVSVHYSDAEKELGLPLNDILVKITNLTSGQVYTQKTDAGGKAVFASIAPGNYNLNAEKNFTKAEYTTATGLAITTDIAFNAAESKSFNVDASIPMVLKTGRIGDLVFKQIYYAGSNTSRGAVFRDQFIEIYNNSNEVIYADSLYFGNSYANMSALSATQQRYDWTKAPGMVAVGDANNDYVYARYLFMIPGTGKQYPIEPGKSIIIAQTAINHTQPFVGNDGKTYSVTDPALTVDLSQADFETYVVEYKRAEADDPTKFKPYMWDIDNPQIKNVNVLHIAAGQDYVLDALGRDDFFIFKTTQDPSTWKKYAAPVTGNTNNYIQIPVKYIIDAVEVKHAVESSRSAKRLPEALDGNGTFVAGGQYSSQSIIRKTAKTVSGRRILQDTNNSANDFFNKSKADPSKSETSFTEN